MAGADTQRRATSAAQSHSLLNIVLERTNYIVTALTALSILYTRSAAFAYFAIGAVLCAVSAKCVKRLVRQPRPVHSGTGLHPKKTYGMPSTHSAVITHFAVYTCLASAYLPQPPAVLRALQLLSHLARKKDHHQNPQHLELLPPLFVVPLAGLIVHSRVVLGHHTWPQCLAGCLFGALFSLAWFKLWASGIHVYGPMLEDFVNQLVFPP